MADDEYDALVESGLQELYNALGPQWVADHAQELYEEHYDQATREFSEGRLKSYYLGNPQVALPALLALAHAKTLQPHSATAALVFAAVSAELTLKSAVLKPLVSGIVLIEALAQPITKSAIPKRGALPPLAAMLLREAAGIDLTKFTRTGSQVPLMTEILRVFDLRNAALHEGRKLDDQAASQAVEVAQSLLQELLPQVLAALRLHLDQSFVVRDAPI